MEEKVANTLLEEKKVIVIEGESYKMSPPSIATLVLSSKYIKQLPKEKLDPKRLIPEMIQISDSILPLGLALSAMILGVKEFDKLEKFRPIHLFRKRKKQGYVLAEKINNAPVKQILNSFYSVLESMNLSDFFQLTTFLIELNLTSPTKKVVEMTASGQ